MPEDLYILWNADNGGWLTRTGQYTSKRTDADEMMKHKALQLVERSYNSYDKDFGLLPVCVEDLAVPDDKR